MSVVSETSPTEAPINILIVDDEPKNLTVLESVLTQANYRLVRAESGDAALLALVAEEFALIILDINMPGMSGLELAAIIKDRKKTAQVPIIFLTAYYNEDQHMLTGYGTGAVDYLLKPVNPAILRSKVGVFAELHRKSRETAVAHRILLGEMGERRRAEEKLRVLNEELEQRVVERTEKVESILRSISDGLMVLDANWRFTFFSERAAAMVRRPRVDLIGACVWDVFPHTREGQTSTEFRLAVTTGQPQQFQEYYPAPVDRWFEFHCHPSAEGLAVYFHDITARRQAEDSLRHASRLKDEFLAMLGHELRNPLSAIANAVELLREAGSDPQEAAWPLSMLERQRANLTRIVDDLLDVARITRGQITLQLERVNVGEIIERAVETVLAQVEKKGHELIHSRGLGSDLIVEADATRLEQCVVNLLVNAAKYTAEKGRISVSASREGKYAVIAIRDNGIGIDQTILPHVFELFTQAERSLDRAEGGLGIGLNICRQIVELHGGTITAHSAGPGTGAEFQIRLPVVALSSSPSGSNGPALPDRSAEKRVSRRILVVDDNTDSANALAMLLRLRGHLTRVAHDGLEAIDAAAEFRPDVFLLDLGLPGIDGYEVARRVRAGEFPNAHLIAISGYAQESDQRDALEAGFDAHFAKPVELQTILAAIDERARQGP